MKIFKMVAGCVLLASLPAQAQTCADYPLTPGMSIDTSDAGVRIISTGVATVNFDDVSAVNDAREDARMSATAAISRFFQEGIRSEQTVNRIVNETVTMQGESRSAARQEVVTRVTSLANATAGLLRGVVPLGDCYTPGREVRVSVGVKPETIAAAGNMSNQMGQSLATQPAPGAGTSPPAPSGGSSGASGATAAQPGNAANPGLNRVPGFSNTQGLNRF